MTSVGSLQTAAATVQAALSVLASLQLTAYQWPPAATVANGTTFDFIIPGGGVAGSVVARRLVDAGHSVLLIEAGGDAELEATIPYMFPYMVNSDVDWAFTTEETEYSAAYHTAGGIYNPSGKMMGGSGSFFLHFMNRADPSFYDGWAAALNDSSWSYNETLPYFKMSETVYDDEIMSSKYASYHGTDGPVGLRRFLYNDTTNYLNAFAELGNNILLDKNGRDSVGYVYPLFNAAGETFQNPALLYLSPVKDNSNLYVLKNTLATKVIFNENQTAVAVEVLDSTNSTLVFSASKEIILAAGALKTPQLLMLSGVGPKEHLESFNISVVADLPVGQQYRDLFGAVVGHRMQAANASTAAASPYVSGPIMLGFAALNKSQTSHPDYLTENFLLTAGGTTSAVYCSFYLGLNDEICQNYLDVQTTNDLLLTFVVKLDPRSTGKVLLRSADPQDALLIYTGFLNNTQDQADLVEFLQDYAAVVNTTYFQSVGAEYVRPNVTECADLELYSADYWNCYVPRMVISIFKYMSTCPMGSVVDSQLRVAGVSSLRVVDASVFPSATRAHPLATVLMVAEKAAAMIISDYS